MPKSASVALVLLAVQAAGIAWLSGLEVPPALPELTAGFPQKLGSWTKSGEEALDPAALSQLGADRTLHWNYFDSQSGKVGNVFVAWFQSQRGGATQPHSPQVCLPGNGWTAEALTREAMSTSAGEIPVNRYVVSKGGQRATVLYWYQSPRRVVASEWAAKYWLVPDAVRDRRTDTALVRVLVWNASDAAAVDLGAQVYPALKGLLPR